MLDQAGVDRYIRSFYKRLSSTWRKRLTIVGIHNYSDVNRNRSTGTAKIINTVRRYNRRAKFWFTETGAIASFGGSFPYSESRQAARMKNMFTYASRYRSRGVQRVYSYNWTGLENGTACGSALPLRRRPRRPRRDAAAGLLGLQAEARQLLALSTCSGGHVHGEVTSGSRAGRPVSILHVNRGEVTTVGGTKLLVSVLHASFTPRGTPTALTVSPQ